MVTGILLVTDMKYNLIGSIINYVDFERVI